MGYNLFRGLTTYLYWGYNPVTKYHGHPSKKWPIWKDGWGFRIELRMIFLKIMANIAGSLNYTNGRDQTSKCMVILGGFPEKVKCIDVYCLGW